MTWLARSGAMALGALCVWADAVACVTQLYGRNDAGSIGIVAMPGVNEQWIAGGIAYWDSCSESTFPALLCNQPGDYTFEVHYQPFANPRGTGCGSADPQLDWDQAQNAWVVRGGKIYIFEKDRFGFPCNNSVEARSHTVGHEIGHILGLDDSSCTNQIMGSSTAPVHPDECAQVDDQWQTAIETRIEQCQASCTTSCDGNGDCAPPPPHWDPGTDWFDPLVFDLENDGIHTKSGDEAVSFDLDGDGRAERISWIEAGDAFLWTDLNGNQRVDDGSELFGVGTVLHDGTRARHGYEALAMYDLPEKGGDGNGRIDREDVIWNRLRLWRDQNGDGVCDAGEASPIHRFGVKEIGLDWVPAYWMDAAGTLHLLSGVYRKHIVGLSDPKYMDYPVEALAFRRLN